MPRPCKRRRVCALPERPNFGPVGAGPVRQSVPMTVDEFETIRLIDLEGLTQEACAGQMEVSRATVQAIGYKEFLGVLDGTATVEEAVAEVKLRSRQYAKRQLTWLRRNPDIHWIWWEKDRDFARALQVSTEILAAAGVF